MPELRVERDRLRKGAYRTGAPIFRVGFVEVPHLDEAGTRVAWDRYTDAEWDALPNGPAPEPEPEPEPPTPPTTAIGLSGAYVGAAAASRATQFGNWRGKPLQVIVDFTANTWADIERAYVMDTWRSQYPLALTTYFFPPGGSLAAAARGDYDAYWRGFANRIKATGGANNLTVRPGWEMNGPWFPHNINLNGEEMVVDSAKAANYVLAFRRYVNLLRSVNPGLRFDWCPTHGKANPASCYPGDEYVDIIGLDSYDNRGSWDTIVNNGIGLQWQKNFAAQHGKPVSFPEWGLVDTGHWGQGDNPTYIQNMRTWINGSNLAYEAYFEFDAPDGKHMLETTFPQSGAKYRELW